MAVLTTQQVIPNGVAPSYSAAGAGGDFIVDDGKEQTFLHVKNASGGSINVTITPYVASRRVAGIGTVTLPNIVVAVPATTGDRMIGPFPEGYRNPGGQVAVTYSGVTSLTVAAIQVAPSSL